MEEEFCFGTPLSSVGRNGNLLCDTSLGTGSRDCCRMCHEWQTRSKKAEERCTVLELEIQKKNIDYELLQTRFVDLAGEKLAIGDHLEDPKGKNEFEKRNSIKGHIVDLTEETDEEEKVFHLMTENKNLECEKRQAENQVDIWKVKFKELESKFFKLEERLLIRDDDLNLTDKLMNENEDSRVLGNNEQSAALTKSEDTSLIDTPGKDPIYVSEEKGETRKINRMQIRKQLSALGDNEQSAPLTKSEETLLIDTRGKDPIYVSEEKRETRGINRKRVRKQLSFGEEERPQKKLAPSTPAVVIPASTGVVNVISDSDDSQETKNEIILDKILKTSLLDQNDEDDIRDFKWSSSFATTPRRKRASNIISSDSEDDDRDDDDNLPINSLKTKRVPQTSSDPDLIDPSPSSTVSKRRLVTLSELEGQKAQEIRSTNVDVIEDIQNEEDGLGSDSGSDSGSLDDFIVDSSSPSVSGSGDVASSVGDSSEEENLDYREVISSIGSKSRNRVGSFNWKFEADMLADFGKDPELCMKAVCALYRQQTYEEKSSKETIYHNQRGFSHCDAYRGSELAEFLTDGDGGDLVKTVAELREYNPKGVDLCRVLATRYSKQLFAIYENKEDPFFCPREDDHQD